MNAITIYLADDQQMVREALTVLLNLQPQLQVIGSAGDGATTLHDVEKLQPDVVLLDIEMPEMNGIEVAQALNERGIATRSLIVTTFGRPGYLERALEAGVSGFVVKDTPAAQLAEAVRKVNSGFKVIDPVLIAQSYELGRSPLSHREQEVLRASKDGAAILSIAARLHLSQGTVRNHISNAMAKLNADNRFEAAQTAERNGWL